MVGVSSSGDALFEDLDGDLSLINAREVTRRR
jgi:hypothetical protein